MEMALSIVNRPQNQPKSHESGKGTDRDQSGVHRAGSENIEGMDVRVIRKHHVYVLNCPPTR